MSPDVVLRPASLSELDDAARARAACWAEAYADLLPPTPISAQWDRIGLTVAAWRHAVEGGETVWLALDSQGIVGVAHAFQCQAKDAPNLWELGTLYVRQRGQGRGIGAALVTASLGERPAHTWVLENNVAGLGFYARFGFVPDGVAAEVAPSFEGVRQVRLVRSGTVPGQRQPSLPR